MATLQTIWHWIWITLRATAGDHDKRKRPDGEASGRDACVDVPASMQSVRRAPEWEVFPADAGVSTGA